MDNQMKTFELHQHLPNPNTREWVVHSFIFTVYSEDHTTIYRNRSVNYPVSDYIAVYPHGRPSYHVNMDNPLSTEVARDVWRQLMVEGRTLGKVKWKETTR